MFKTLSNLFSNRREEYLLESTTDLRQQLKEVRRYNTTLKLNVTILERRVTELYEKLEDLRNKLNNTP